ncbi:MAG: ribose-5-phosphate isomerase RpiA [Nitrospira sp.]|nr:ribose-5-phosphate isomerase RpiA [Nitrospira sp.]
MTPSPQSANPQESGKRAAGEAALDFIQDGALVGLGTGSTVKYFLLALGERVKAGLRVHGVPTSRETAELARQLQITLLPEQEEWMLDVAVDGADQVDPQFHLIKGGGGALLREKIVAAAARTFIVLVDPTKCVPVLGKPMPVPVEVNPFGWPQSAKQLEALGGVPTLRKKQGTVFETDGGHYILDFLVDSIPDPTQLEARLNRIPGVVENGLFVNRTSTLIIGSPDGVEIKHCPS